MKRKILHAVGVGVLLLVVFTSCGTGGTRQAALPTPTPLPPDPALARPRYQVQRGVIERSLEANGRVTPRDLARLSFGRTGRVAQVQVKVGDRVKAGVVLAELLQADAKAALRAAEDAVAAAQRTLTSMQEQRTRAIRRAQLELADAQDDLNHVQGTSAYAIRKAQRVVERQQLLLEEAQATLLNVEQTAVEGSQRVLAQAQQQVQAGQVRAEQAGQVLALAIAPGDDIQAFAPIMEVGDPATLEVAAELPGDQMSQLVQGQAAEIRLLAHPEAPLAATVRQLPAPLGQGGSGTVHDADKTTRFALTDPHPLAWQPGDAATMRVVLERRADALWLPPAAIRSFEGRRFVVVQEGERERRVTVTLGIETPESSEIVDGLSAGMTVVGQ
ncbi:MAG: efflux RND transporter periplasmic adaptor subunit [Herpetosiphonaceae bacterium]|nr:efflux RND transporter periplasmic adaptor subunit [Herpetosiphonaceae bacterium]